MSLSKKYRNVKKSPILSGIARFCKSAGSRELLSGKIDFFLLPPANGGGREFDKDGRMAQDTALI